MAVSDSIDQSELEVVRKRAGLTAALVAHEALFRPLPLSPFTLNS